MRLRASQVVLLALAVVLTADTAAADSWPTSPLPPYGPRFVVFVSDLHMGVGIDPAAGGQRYASPPLRNWENTIGFNWHKTEDFRWHREFGDFLWALDSRLGASIDLVILGDFLELWQSLDTAAAAGGAEMKADCDHSKISKDLGCTEAEAVRRAKRVLGQHDYVFRQLAFFAKARNHRVVLVPGNHDIALAYPAVRGLVLEKFAGLEAGRFEIATGGYWRSRDGLIYAEHGQQIGKDPNRFEGFPQQQPLVTRDGETYLIQTWGEQFVQEFFNRYEGTYSVIDNISEMLKGVAYAQSASDLGDKLEDLARASRFLLTRTSWTQTEQILGKDGIPEWDLTVVRKDYAEPEGLGRVLPDSLPASDPLRRALEERLAAGEELPPIEEFDDQELEVICNRRWAAHQADPEAGVVLCASTGKLNAISEQLVERLFSSARDAKFREHLEVVRDNLPEDSRPTRSFGLFVYGHTHKEQALDPPFEAQAPWRPKIFNDGAWQRTASPEVICTILKTKQPGQELTLDQIEPEDLPPCYPFVLATHGDGKPPSPQLLYWVQEPGKEGKLRESCAAEPAIVTGC